MEYPIISLGRHPERIEEAALWFQSKWGISEEIYEESMRKCVGKNAVPQWYIVLDRDKIVAGIGVIENDFHVRKDLTPNVCAVYVEEAYRKRGIAGQMLDFVVKDMEKRGIRTLYLLTDHTSFYERYGWEFLTMAESEDGSEISRLYVHRCKAK